jgi:homoprotocatechuate degradation regulator HpaR
MSKHGAVRHEEANPLPVGQPWPAEVRTYDVSQSLPTALVQARESIMWMFRPILREYALTDLQWRVLLSVRSAGQIEVAKLARVSCLLAPSLSRVLKDLLARGLINRRASAKDQRRYLISISEEGERLMCEVFPKVLDGYDVIEARYGPEKLEMLRSMLHDLWDELSKKK